MIQTSCIWMHIIEINETFFSHSYVAINELCILISQEKLSKPFFFSGDSSGLRFGQLSDLILRYNKCEISFLL